jgi:hypothetical protein
LEQTSDDSDDGPNIASLVSISTSSSKNDKDNNRNMLHKSMSRSSSNTTTCSLWSLFTQNWLPEGPWQVGELQQLEVEGINLFKKIVITFVHYYAIVLVVVRTTTVLCQYLIDDILYNMISDSSRMNDEFSFLLSVLSMIAYAFWFHLLVFGKECLSR